jgi:cellulose synthase/poly-beta-1,6-N-acetylglucosamine synthase-like glycosyltransferase
MFTVTVETALVAAFWIGLFGTLYAYAGFPTLATWLAAFRRSNDQEAPATEPRASVTIVIPAYNEKHAIAGKIRNVLEADYPRSLLDVLVVSDASTDGTTEVAAGFSGDGVRMIVQKTRRGKTAGLNRALDIARGDIVVFTDANATYPAGTIGVLVDYFRDPRVGLVTGYTRYTTTESGDVAGTTNAYTMLERIIKSAESQWGCCVGADGAIFAMRRSLYRTLRDDDINDFVLPLSVIDQGYRCVFASDAFCSEKPGKNLESEFRRQSRITNRTLRALWRNVHLLNPLRFPLFAFFLFSHKIVRFLVPAFIMLCLASALCLAPSGGFYLFAAFVVLLGVASGVVSALKHPNAFVKGMAMDRLLRAAGVFVTINVAMLHGWWKFLSGQNDVTWRHDRSPA